MNLKLDLLESDLGPATPPPKPYTIWRPSEILAWEEPEGNHLLLPAYMSKGALTVIVGQAGVGKTRLSLWLAICQILGREWCGLKTHGDPQTWLFVGDENALPRWKEDLRRMFSTLTEEEVALVDQHLRLPAILTPDDGDIWLGDSETQERLAETITGVGPGVIVADPLTNFAPEDVSKPGPMKDAVRLIVSIVRQTAPQAVLLLLHHAKPGRQNILGGVGWDAGAFASGGKALTAAARCQMNLMPGDAEDDSKLVLSCAKSNNCERFETRGLKFDRETFTYAVEPEFDLEAWKADVEGKAKAGQSLCTVQEVTGAVADGYTTTKALVETLSEACAASKRTVERVITKAVECGAIQPLSRGKFALGRKSAKYLPRKD